VDPNEALRELRRIMTQLDKAQAAWEVEQLAERAADVFGGLDDWLSKGGFLPDEWRRR